MVRNQFWGSVLLMSQKQGRGEEPELGECFLLVWKLPEFLCCFL